MTWFLCLLLRLIWKGRCDDDDRSFTVNDGEVENERGSFTGMSSVLSGLTDCVLDDDRNVFEFLE